MPSATRLYTVEDVRAMPDDANRYETIAGELFVTPAPGTRHQTVLGRLYQVLAVYVGRHRLGQLWFAPLDVVFDRLTLVEPDLVFVRADRGAVVTERGVTGPPDLAVEVISPSSGRTDRGRKRALYQSAGVGEYWIVDLELRRVEVWRPGAMEAAVAAETLRWQPRPEITALEVDLKAVFG
jgi:Uma2 family endonuclease